jgi:RNA polymerase sigma-70 factor (ECF subfamily)
MELAWRTGVANASGESDTDDPQAATDADYAIITAAKIDPLAFAPLYQRYAPLILRYCERRLGHPELANDATAQTFTKAIAALGSFNPHKTHSGATFRGWLFTIAHNVIVDTHRRNRKHLSLDDEPTALWLNGTSHLTDTSPTPEEQMLGRDVARRVRSMLAHLPDRQRQIVELRLVGLSGIEIAAAMGMTLAAVKSAQARAYATLRELLHDDRPNPEADNGSH